MGKIARIISSKIDDNNNIICTCEAHFGHNIQAPLFLPPGDDSYPIDDDRTILVKIEGTGNYIACGILTKNIDATSGEKLLFSRDSNGNTKAKILLNDDGTIKINDGTDFAVRYNELETAFNQLKDDFDNFVDSIYGNHIHPAVTTATVGIGAVGAVTISPTTTTGTASTADITPAKIDDINLQGVGE